MKSLSFATAAVALATLSLVAARAEEQAPAAQPAAMIDGVHSPVTHLLEVINAPVLQASKTDTVHGTLAERPSPARHTDTALNGK
jgi:hypothetical protein